jgi:3-dehydroquinate dehydratase-1
VDWFDDVFETEKVIETAKALRETLGETPILFTFRTSKEGGEKAISDEDYVALNKAICESGYVDLIDVEAFTGDKIVTKIIENAHTFGVKVVGSNHDFHKTPEKEEIIRRLCKMQELGADIPKIALMPESKQDVLTLLSATLEMSENHADRPIITMSMAGTGVISRLAGESFGSALTFGAASKASAPGQVGVNELKQVLDIIHASL